MVFVQKSETGQGEPNRYPFGKLNAEDRGEVEVKVGSDRDTETVIIEFPYEVAWVAMRPEQAEFIADALRKHAERARR